jgi:hypothetical protein
MLSDDGLLKTIGGIEDMKKLIFIGNNYYSESGSWMSSLYEEGTWSRYDWGFVQRDLGEGIPITIRPATEDELIIANQKLLEFKARYDRFN